MIQYVPYLSRLRPTHMHLRRAIFAVLGAILLAPGIHPQDSITTPGERIPGTRSFYLAISLIVQRHFPACGKRPMAKAVPPASS